MADLETQIAQALVHLEYLREDVTETKTLVKAQNGRVRALENHVTEMKAAAKASGRNHGASWGAGAGAVIAGALTALWHTFSGAK